MARLKMSVTEKVDRPIKQPVMTVTRYERVSTSLIAVVLALIVAVISLFLVWLSNRPEKAKSEAVLEIIELSGGVETGSPDETLLVESPEDVRPDPALPEVPTDVNEVSETIENVLELSDEAALQVPEQFDTAVENTGSPGSATGTGRPALGMGPGEGGFPRHQRWFVRFAERGTLDEYARQLDYFGIELGVLTGGGEILFVSRLSDAQPQVRRVTTGKGEKRLFFSWQGGNRREADLQLFQKAKVSVSGGMIFHFYPPETENLLAKAELEYRNREVKDIRRTFYTVRPASTGYQFEVTKQSYY